MYQTFIAAQEAEEGGRWRDARDLYREAGAQLSAREMGSRYVQELEDRLALTMIADGQTPRRRWTDVFA